MRKFIFLAGTLSSFSTNDIESSCIPPFKNPSLWNRLWNAIFNFNEPCRMTFESDCIHGSCTNYPEYESSFQWNGRRVDSRNVEFTEYDRELHSPSHNSKLYDTLTHSGLLMVSLAAYTTNMVFTIWIKLVATVMSFITSTLVLLASAWTAYTIFQLNSINAIPEAEEKVEYPASLDDDFEFVDANEL